MAQLGRPIDIVHVTHSAFPEDPRPRREAAAAAALGVRVAVISLQSAPEQPRVSRWGRILVVRLPGRKRRGGPLSYFTDYLTFVFRARALFARAPRLRRARIVHVHTLPDFLIAAANPAQRAGAKVILDMHEIFPEFTRSKFPGPLGAAGEWLARQLERWSRRRADTLLTVNRPIRALLESRPARSRETIEVIHNSPDPNELPKLLTTRQPPQGELRLVYHGTLTRLYGLDLAVHAVAKASALGAQVTLDIFGDGPERAAISVAARALGMSTTIRVHGQVPVSQLATVLPTFSAGFVPTRLDVMTQYSLSTKLLEYVHLRMPLLAPRLPTYLSYFPEEVAWYFVPNDPASAAETIVRLAAASATERAQRTELAALAAQACAWAPDIEKLQALYRRLLAAAGPR